MKRKKGEFAPRIIECLLRKRYMIRREISERLGVSADYVFSGISSLRDRGWQIFTTDKGYTLRPKPEDLIYESKLRFRNSYGTLTNGQGTFEKAKEQARLEMLELVKVYLPKINNIVNIITTKKEDLLQLPDRTFTATTKE